MPVIWPQEVDCDIHFSGQGDLAESEQVLLRLEAPITPDFHLLDHLTQFDTH